MVNFDCILSDCQSSFKKSLTLCNSIIMQNCKNWYKVTVCHHDEYLLFEPFLKLVLPSKEIVYINAVKIK